jgi:hypothetical protein
MVLSVSRLFKRACAAVSVNPTCLCYDLIFVAGLMADVGRDAETALGIAALAAFDTQGLAVMRSGCFDL